MKPLIRHLRFSGLLWWIIPLALLDVATLFLRTRYWIGIWPEAGAAAQVPAFLLGIAACGASAWMSGARSRNGLDDQLAATGKPSALIDLYRLSAVVTAFAFPYLCGVVAAWSVTWPTDPPGISMFFGYVLMGACVIVLSCSWGWLLGKLLTGRFAAIASVLTWIIATMAFRSATNISVMSGPPWKEVDFPALVLRFGAVAAFSCAILFLPSRISPRKLPSRVASLASIAAGITVVLAISGVPAVVDRTAPESLPCTSGAMKMCYWPEHEKYLGLMKKIDARAATLPKGFSLPDRVYEYGTREEVFHVDGVTHRQATGDFTIMEGNRWSLASSISSVIAGKTFSSCDWQAAAAKHDSTADAVGHWVEIYLAGGGDPDYRLEGATPEYVKASEESAAEAKTHSKEEQFAWVHKKMEDFRARYCR
ncbi:hypothetical protein [Streptomyces sp. NPDC007905]|uniref:hypothetical protein n=1 Tax=Streptomyces sp. NPDC007905 TaxID=3364788 RepID=UPI0036E9C180